MRRDDDMVEDDREDDDDALDEGQSRGRALLLESQADELRDRLDALLAELARHHRRGAVDLRRYAIPGGLAIVAVTTGILAFVGWRRRRRLESWARLSGRTQARISRFLLS
jgi:hypothetical protein